MIRVLQYLLRHVGLVGRQCAGKVCVGFSLAVIELRLDLMPAARGSRSVFNSSSCIPFALGPLGGRKVCVTQPHGNLATS